jgi:SAM-dependent methyltransferase
MHEEEFRLLDSIEDDHWWFVGKRRILEALLASDPATGRLLDLGCGTGGVLREIAPERPCVGLDRSALALRICRDKGFRELARGDLSALPFAPASFETVIALDVIEHLDDDVGFLRQAARLCAPGGRMIVAVPAFQLLWSQHDETFEHRRRYRARQLEEVVRAAGLQLERTTYTNFFVFPVAALWRVLSYRLGLGRLAPRHDFWPLPRFVNALLVRLYTLEARLLRSLDLPVGVSLVCVARRPGTGPVAPAGRARAPGSREVSAGL